MVINLATSDTAAPYRSTHCVIPRAHTLTHAVARAAAIILSLLLLASYTSAAASHRSQQKAASFNQAGAHHTNHLLEFKNYNYAVSLLAYSAVTRTHLG